MSEIPQETIDWLKEQHAVDIERFKYALCEGSAWYYTKKYLERTPLSEIKANCYYKGKEMEGTGMFILTHSGALYSTKKIRAFTPETFDGAAFIFCELDDKELNSIAIGKYENLNQARSVIADIHYQMSRHKGAYRMPSIEEAALMAMGDKRAAENEKG